MQATMNADKGIHNEQDLALDLFIELLAYVPPC